MEPLLVDEADDVSQDNAPSGLHSVSFKNGSPLVLAVRHLNLKRTQNVVMLAHNIFVVNRLIIYHR